MVPWFAVVMTIAIVVPVGAAGLISRVELWHVVQILRWVVRILGQFWTE